MLDLPIPPQIYKPASVDVTLQVILEQTVLLQILREWILGQYLVALLSHTGVKFHKRSLYLCWVTWYTLRSCIIVMHKTHPHVVLVET